MQIKPFSSLRRADSVGDPSVARALNKRIQVEQVALLYRNAPIGFVVSLAASTLLAVALSMHVPPEPLAIWYGLLSIVTAGRFYLTRLYHKSTSDKQRDRGWETRFMLGTGAAGLVWGLSMVLLFPSHSVAYQFLIALVLAGLVGGAVALFSARKAVFIVFSFMILTPVALRFLYEEDSVYRVLALMVVIYLAGMIVTARNTERVIRIALALRFDNQELIEHIVQRERIESSLRRSEERFRDFTESAADFFWELDERLRLADVSDRFQEITGLRREEVIGKEAAQLMVLYGNDLAVPTNLAHCLEERQLVESFELDWRVAASTVRKLVLDGKPIFDKGGAFQGYRGVGRDVTKERHAAHLIKHQAKHDELTGLVNRREFMRRLETALKHSKRDGSSHVLCYLDLDRFKVVNDTVGHAAGDELLKELSGVLRGTLRTRDTLSRLGGDEFALLLENCRLEGGVAIAESLLAVLSDFRFRWDKQEFQVGVSVGVVLVSAQDETPLQVLTKADLACYTAKDRGRNRVQVYSAGDGDLSSMETQMVLVSQLRAALRDNRFRLYRQPIRSITDANVEHYELLLRMEDLSGQILMPSSFIPAAERYGIMKEIDRWVIENALDDYFQENGSSSNVTFSVNLSSNSLSDEDFLPWMRAQLKRSKVAPDRLCLDVTEAAVIRNLNQAGQLINDLKAEGCRFALDDFGSGLSSFAYIKYLPVDYVKIHGDFVSNMERDVTGSAMVAAISKMAHVLGIKTVAERVENADMVQMLREVGVDYVQGYALGEPMPAQDLKSATQFDGELPALADCKPTLFEPGVIRR